MIKIKMFILFVICIIIYSMHGIISFDESMQVHNVRVQKLLLTEQLLPIARLLYTHYNPELICKKACPVIPHIIHHVWFGQPLSDEDKTLRATWQQFHPTYHFILWTDRIENDSNAVLACSWQDVKDLLQAGVQYIVADVKNLVFDNRIYFDAAPNYGERSDILKYEIVHQIGGMYVDFDFECLKPFDELFDRYDFFTGIQPLDTNIEQLGAALFAAKRGHPILGYTINTIKDNRHFQQIIVRTGPIHFSRAFIKVAGAGGNIDIAFPASFFYPYGYQQQGQPRDLWMRPESFAVHHWAGSWLKPEAFARSY